MDSSRNRPVSITVNRSVSERKAEVAIRSSRVSAQARRESVIRTAVADSALTGHYGTSKRSSCSGRAMPPRPAAEAKGDAAKARADWMRPWEDAYLLLGADADETTAFLARGMPVNTLTATGAGAIGLGRARSRRLLERGCVSTCLPHRAGWSRWA
ncbi:hypothetical protein GCM10010304_40840 [Streptomyces roseoviolaceus]